MWIFFFFASTQCRMNRQARPLEPNSHYPNMMLLQQVRAKSVTEGKIEANGSITDDYCLLCL